MRPMFIRLTFSDTAEAVVGVLLAVAVTSVMLV